MTAGTQVAGLAAALAFGVAWLLVPGGTTSLRRLGGTPDSGARVPGKLLVMCASGFLAWQLLRAEGPRVLILGFGAAAVTAVTQRLVGGWRLRQARSRRQAACVEWCDALAAELDGGLPAVTALERSCASWPELSGVVAAARLGDDVGAALRRSAQLPGAEGLRAAAASWDVAARSGAALSVVLTKVASGLRSDEEARAEVVAALGPPRATAKMLAALPLFGIGLGFSMGANPLSFLLHTGAGVVCLALGTALALLGVWWVERLASAAEI